MAQFSVNAGRFDPYKNFKFQVKWDGRYVAGGSEVSLKDFRKDVIIEVYNEAGQVVLGYKVFRCWVSEYQAMPDLDANANAVAIQHIKLENEGWERDTDVPVPSEPSFTIPSV